MTSPEPAGDRLHTLVDSLIRRGLTVATAESLTGGLLGALITAVPGASATFRGGLIVYATDLKASLAHVDPDLLTAGGPVQPQVAVQLADGARMACAASIGVGLTGVAGPDPVDGRPPGTWFVAVTGPDLTLTRAGTPAPAEVPPTRAEVRADAVAAAIELLELALATEESRSDVAGRSSAEPADRGTIPAARSVSPTADSGARGCVGDAE